MGILYRSAVSLGFRGDDLDPTAISAALGGVPTLGVAKGGLWHTSSGAPVTARIGMWHIKLPVSEPGDLDGQISRVLLELTADLGVWRDLASRYDGRLFGGLFLATFNERAVFQPRTLNAIGDRGLILDLDIYSGEPQQP